MREDVTRLLQSWKGGDDAALESLVELLYPELKRIASMYLRRERSGHTLQTTALVNEAFLQFGGLDSVSFTDRSHFLGIAARIMRQVLIQHARKTRATKRGGDVQKVSLSPQFDAAAPDDDAVLEVDEALQAFAKIDPERARLVELRYFGGLTNDEIAATTGLSESTVLRHLKLAQAWLHRYLVGSQDRSKGEPA